MRENDAIRGIIESSVNYLEACGFARGFRSNEERIEIKNMISNQARLDHQHQKFIVLGIFNKK